MEHKKQKSSRKIAGDIISYASLKKGGGFVRPSMDGLHRNVDIKKSARTIQTRKRKKIDWQKICGDFFASIKRENNLTKRAVSLLMIIAIASVAFLQNSNYTKGATYTWQQTTWSGGITSNNAVHPTNQTSWNEYFAKDASTETLNGGEDISVAWTNESSVQTSSTGTEDTHNIGGFNAGANTNTKVFGAGQAAGVKLGFAGVAALSAGRNHVLTIKSDNTVWAWGANGSGQLGDSTITNRYTPVQVYDVGGSGYLEDIEAVSAGNLHSLALRADGTVLAWGINDNGQLGDNTDTTRNVPVQVVDSDGSGNLSDVVAVAAGDKFSLALKSDGTVWAWGINDNGQLGNGTNLEAHLPVQVLGVGGSGFLTGIDSIAVGGSFVLALGADGNVFSWGNNSNGQLGNNTIISESAPVEVLNESGSAPLDGVKMVKCGTSHAIALKTDGTVRSWGNNDKGQLGDNSATERHLPVQILNSFGGGNLQNIVSVGAGYRHSLAIDSGGFGWAWGYNGTGQLADNTIAEKYLPTEILDSSGTGNLQDMKFITGGEGNSYAFQNDGTVWTWGDNLNGQLGNNTTTGSRLPLQTWGPAQGTMDDATKVVSGYAHSLALKSDGTVWTWGWNGNGQLGDNTTTNRLTPVQVLGSGGSGFLSDVIDVAAGYSHSVALKSDGTVWAWGWNAYGQLGDGTSMNRYTPVQVVDYDGSGYFLNVKNIACGNTFTLATRTDDTAWTWGNNSSGQLGDNTTDLRVLPGQVLGTGGVGFLTDIMMVAGGEKHSLALKNDGTVWAWGNNSNGQLGDNTVLNKLTPIQVYNYLASGYLQNITYITAGNSHSMALQNDNTAWAWGWNANGQIGDGTIVDARIPSHVVGSGGVGVLQDIASISCGNAHSVALKTDGTVWAWGWNGFGQLGNNSSTSSNYPVQTLDGTGSSNLSDVDFISAGYAYTVAGKSDGTDLWGWGSNIYGQLGINTYVSHSLPVSAWGPAAGTLVLGITHYFTSGIFNSAVVDTGNIKTYLNLNFSRNTPSGSSVTVDIRAGNTAIPDGSWTSWSNDVIQGGDISVLGQHRYYQYRVNFSTTDNAVTPSFNDISVSYEYYPAVSTLTSTAYNTSDAANILSRISWNETIESGTDIGFQVRTAIDNAGVPGSWLEWIGPDGTGNTYFTDNTGSEATPAAVKDGAGDQWIQYRAYLMSDGVERPILEDVTTQYVVNAPPELRNVSAVQENDGTVRVDYEVRDPDTLAGATPGEVVISLQYCSANCAISGGETWTNATTTGGDVGASIDVEEVNWNAYQLTWNPKIDYPNVYQGSNFKVRVRANDSEGANNLGYGRSASFILDTKNPTNLGLFIDHTQNLLTLDTPLDDSSYQMMISNYADFHDASYQVFQSSYVYGSLSEDPATVYLRIGDAYGNYTDISATTPDKPNNAIYYDASDTVNDKYRELIVWDVVDVGQVGAGFSRYNIWRSTDGVDYGSNPIATNTDRLTNYYLDVALVENTRYYYKITTEDINGSISEFSNVTSDIPDGNGEVSSIPPVISNVQISNVTTTTAEITWDTDILANATVGYSTTPGDFSSETGVSTMATNHSVVLSGLSPGQTYYYQVKSADVYGNLATDDSQAPFDTDPLDVTAPVISNIATVATSNAATITWTTDEVATSFVEYSTTPSFPAGQLTGLEDSVTGHSITISGLSSEQIYYFRVHSKDVADNEAISAEGDFTTLAGPTGDITPPVVSNISVNPATNGATITWTTDEASTSFVEYSQISGFTTGTMVGSDEPVTDHSVTIVGLSSEETYYFRIHSEDAANNEVITPESSFTTLAGPTGDITPPVVSNISVNPATNGATITWTTDEASTSFVEYSQISGFTTGTMVGSDEPVTDHSVTIVGLSSEETYYFRIHSEDAANNEVITPESSFTTLAGPTGDITPPVVSNISVNPATNGATITWTTDEASTSFVEYSQISGFTTGTMVGSDEPVTDHSVTIVGLSSEETYYFRIHSEDAANNEVITPESSFTTLAGPVVDITAPIVSGLNENISGVENTVVAITWNTDENATSFVEFGTTVAYGRIYGGDNPVTSHSVELPHDLATDTTYQYRIISEDASGNIGYSANGSFNTGHNESNPVISNIIVEDVSADTALISWRTDKDTNAVVRYDKNVPLAQTVSITNYSKDHFVLLSGLDDDSDYHFDIEAQDVYGNSTTSAQGDFETELDTRLEHDPLSVISDTTVPVVTDTKAVVSFNTDQQAKCFIEYGTQSGVYNEIPVVESSFNRSHSMHLAGLIFSTKYYYKVTCSDDLGTTLSSGEESFTTSAQQEGSEGGEDDGADDTAPEVSGVKVSAASGESVTVSWNTDEKANSLVRYGIDEENMRMDGDELVNADIEKFDTSHTVVINGLVPYTKYYYSVISYDQAGNIAQSAQTTFSTKSPSSLSSINAVSTSINEVKITWSTGQETTSTVEYGLSNAYGETKESGTLTKNHEIIISGLQPAQLYHFRVKGKDKSGSLYSSSDYTFQPKSPPQIADVAIESVTERSAIIKFSTSIPTDALISYVDRNDSKNAGSQGKPDMITSHEVELVGLDPGVAYDIIVIAKDEQGNEAKSEGHNFNTGKDETAPNVDQVKTENALTQNDKVQSIISWTTDEPSTTIFMYKEGRKGDEREIVIDDSFSISHVAVITTFKPGTVYYFRAKSLDQTGNEALSGEFALLTPKRKENVIQLIINNFQEIFGWAKMK
jgi:alpha-tubulin suppressor-like RCC1 family protein